MFFLSASTVIEAWIKCCKLIIKSGASRLELREVTNLVIHIDHSSPRYSRVYFKHFGRITYDQVLSIYKVGGRKHHGFNYGERILRNNGINQIEKIVNILRKDPFSRSATIILSDPSSDTDHLPCIMDINFKVRDERLLMTLILKSNDIPKKFIPDLFCLSVIHQKISRRLKIMIGPVDIFIMSAQVLEKDFDKVIEIVSERF